MIPNLLPLLANNKGHVAAYLIVLVMGVAGYTDLLLELGQLRAETSYQAQMIEGLQSSLDACE